MSTQTITALGTAMLLLASAWRIRRILINPALSQSGALPGHAPSPIPVNLVFSTEHLECYLNLIKN